MIQKYDARVSIRPMNSSDYTEANRRYDAGIPSRMKEKTPLTFKWFLLSVLFYLRFELFR